MTARAVRLSADGRIAVVTLPFRLRRRGRKQVLTADGPSTPRPNDTVIKVLGRAFRWRKLLEDGVYASVEDLAQSEKINPSYVSRVLRLTLLAPSIVEAALAGLERAELPSLLKPLPIQWSHQMDVIRS